MIGFGDLIVSHERTHNGHNVWRPKAYFKIVSKSAIYIIIRNIVINTKNPFVFASFTLQYIYSFGFVLQKRSPTPMKPVISISMLSADFAHVGRDLKAAEAAGVDWIHVDVMDGHFVPNITIGPDQMKNFRSSVSIPFDVHLMISHPLSYIDAFAEGGADSITVHVECEDDTDACLSKIKSHGIKAGVVISPDTPVTAIEPYLDGIDMILVMSVYPGFGGQSYLPQSSERLKAVKTLIGKRPIRLEVDGGINFDTLPDALAAGADTIVSGSCLFRGNIKNNVDQFRTIIDSHTK